MAENFAFLHENDEEDGEEPSQNFSQSAAVDPMEDDYYGYLNVSRQASNDDITRQYRKLSRIYHPDKHQDPDTKAQARQLFGKIKIAYETLMDAQRRAIYDTLGIKGLAEADSANSNTDLVPRYKTAAEIREDYERLQREREERMLERKTNPKGQITVNINAAEIFTPYEGLDDDDEYYYDAGPYLELTGFHFFQSIEAPITTRDTLTMSGTVSAENGRGKGNINCGWRKCISNRAWGEAEIGGSSNGLDFGLKGWSQIGNNFFTNFHANCTSTPDGIRPNMVIVGGMQLDAKSQLTTTYRAGSLGGLQTQYTWEHSRNRFVASFHLGVPYSYVGINYSRKLEDQKMRLRGSIRGGLFGVFAEYGIDRKISQITTLSATISIGVPLGVSLRLKVARANQIYLFPIHLCETMLPAPIVYGTVTPIFLFMVVNKLFVEPYEKEKRAREKAKNKELNKARLAEKQRESQSAINLMKVACDRSVTEEEAKGGLIINSAKYGRLIQDAESAASENVSSGAAAILNDEIIDVHIPLQIMIVDSKLVLQEGSKCQCPGFYDPAPGEDKSLTVQYTFQKRPHEVTIRDAEPLRIPKESHRLNQN